MFSGWLAVSYSPLNGTQNIRLAKKFFVSDEQQLIHSLHVLHQRCMLVTLGNCSRASVPDSAVVRARSRSSAVRPGICLGGGLGYILGLQIFEATGWGG